MKALDLRNQAEAIYKASIEDAKKTIAKLEKRVGFWKKVSGVAFVPGAILGFLVRNN